MKIAVVSCSDAGFLHLAASTGSEGIFHGSAQTDVVHATQLEIPELANISLPIASIQFGTLTGQGLIRSEYGRIVLIDPEGLGGFDKCLSGSKISGHRAALIAIEVR
ncbi:hypothetical protein [Ruegeria sp. HKCCA5426]|uniref:hypothetical protein n=1 Tax=Ruegeria sp. HKCCA5426 TaxID=2682985 RepID=UPI00147F64A7|nr:hypothetical protein [Ruegeria sp. HKCCA5426]